MKLSFISFSLQKNWFQYTVQQYLLLISMFCQSNVSETNVIVINKTIQFYWYFYTKYFHMHVYWRYYLIFLSWVPLKLLWVNWFLQYIIYNVYRKNNLKSINNVDKVNLKPSYIIYHIIYHFSSNGWQINRQTGWQVDM